MGKMDADKAWDKAQEHEPRSSSWGFFGYGDAPGAMGGGVGAFVWFSTRARLMKFIAEVLPFSPPGPCGADEDAVAEQCSQLIKQYQEDSLSLEAMRTTLNQTLRGFSQIEWLGTRKDLLEGDHRYALYVRAQFRVDAMQGEEGPNIEQDSPLDLLRAHGAAIQPAEREDFMEMLVSWGLERVLCVSHPELPAPGGFSNSGGPDGG